MTKCPKCGAENREGSAVCRMCGSAMTGASAGGGQRQADLPPTVVFQEQQAPTDTGRGSKGDGATCPACGTLNEEGWAFCQQCGSRLQPPAAASPPAQSPPMPLGQPTVADQAAIRDFVPPAKKTTPEKPPPSPPVPETPKAATPHQPPPGPSFGQTTVADQSAVSPPPPPAAPMSDEGARPGSGGATMVDARPEATISCQRCGQVNAVGSAFCSGCGGPLVPAQTIVMSSVAAPPEARLQLIMEGGQAGETYDLDDETVIGRNAGDITFPHDGFMSGRHSKIVRRGSAFLLVDEGSRNGTFVRITGEVELKSGDMILIGKQLFKFEV